MAVTRPYTDVAPRCSPRVVVAGDSLSEFNSDSGPTLVANLARGPVSVARALHGGFEFWATYDPTDTRTVTAYDGSTSNYARTLYGLNHGVAGDISTGLLARAAEILTWKPDLVIACVGSNDATQSLPLELYKSNMRSFVDRMRAGGARVIICTVPPRPNTTDWSAGSTQRYLYYQYNNFIREELQYRPGVAAMLDIQRLLINPKSTTGSFISSPAAVLADNRHYSHYGAWVIGKEIDRLLVSLGYPRGLNFHYSGLDDLYDATLNPSGNVIPVPSLLSGGGSVGAGVSGVVPTGFKLERSGGSTVTCVGSIDTDPTYGNSRYLMTFTNPGGGSGQDTFIFYVNPDMSLLPPAGTIPQAGCRLDASAYAGWKALSLRLLATTTAYNAYSFYEQFSGYSGAGNLVPNEAIGLHLQTPPQTQFGAVAENWRWQVTIQLDLAQAGSPTVAIGLPWLRCLKDPRT